MIKLKVHSTEVKLQVGEKDTKTFHASEAIPIYPNPYTGTTEVVPTTEAQTISVHGMMMVEDFTVDPIPSNYGLITQRGSTIIVS